MDVNSQRRWDDSILTKEEADAVVLSKKEAAIKRERIKEYSYVHRVILFGLNLSSDFYLPSTLF